MKCYTWPQTFGPWWQGYWVGYDATIDGVPYRIGPAMTIECHYVPNW